MPSFPRMKESHEEPKSEEDPGFMSSQETYQAWVTEDPRHAEALMAVTRRLLQEQSESMTPEHRAETEALAQQLCDEVGEATIPLHYNPLVDRFLELIGQTSLSDEDEAEVKAMEPQINRLIDMALDLSEPRRTELITTLTATQEQLRVLLKYLAA